MFSCARGGSNLQTQTVLVAVQVSPVVSGNTVVPVEQESENLTILPEVSSAVLSIKRAGVGIAIDTDL